MAAPHRRRRAPASLRIDAPSLALPLAIALADEDSSTTLSSADSDYPPFHAQPEDRSSRKNMKKLSLTLRSSPAPLDPPLPVSPVPADTRRRPSVISLPAPTPTPASLIHRKDEDGPSDAAPYANGPIQIIPGIWIGSEDNARDWKCLVERGIRSILNVAKEVLLPFDTPIPATPLRLAASTPNFRNRPPKDDPTYYPAHLPSGRPAMHYLKLQWSHGQQNLVDDGFKAGMAFADAALSRGEGCLIHCQCGISRSATMVIALVMRAAAERHTSVPPEVWSLQGMQGAYTFVKEKSPHVGPNMSLIYQLLEYEKKLRGDKASPSDSDGSSDDEEEWGRRRQMLDDASDNEADERESHIVMQEAKALDKAMEDRIVARKSSASSMSSTGSGIGMGPAWRSRYGSRKRTGSVASNQTNQSFWSEDLVEEDEEQELLGTGGAFDSESRLDRASLTATSSPEDEQHDSTPRNESLMALHGPATARPPPSAPVWKSSFNIPPPPKTAVRSTFDIPPRPKPRGKPRPMGLSLLPVVPSSPVTLVIETESSDENDHQPGPPPTQQPPPAKPTLPLPPVRQRAESRKLVPPPLHLRSSVLRRASSSSTSTTGSADVAGLSTPSQTLFVFPPSPTLTTRTPSTMTLTSNFAGPVPFPSLSTPRVSTFHSKGRTRSFIGLGAPPTPTVAFSKVDVRGYVGLE
ncbi:Tyrosine-protein phosphatase pmp1 [Psilocybe cubensis]|uniref:Tyrosine-protein phosphatase pmp1 n=1 Tax=Psilocybe cubensis TaxID=181762 RepID=A0ACB8HHT9_PSICU|nr:Tyrosine-protein phosphatase pmp1 [Psilocybe cubensis]KAH9486754.1 Tyrosine-protein phosphatase pmp1 [Psilocybe cubensis]